MQIYQIDELIEILRNKNEQTISIYSTKRFMKAENYFEMLIIQIHENSIHP